MCEDWRYSSGGEAPSPGSPSDESLWCVEANILEERPSGPWGLDVAHGTRKFRPGAKIHIIDWFPGTCDSVTVIGQHRKSRKFLVCILSVRHLTNLRVKMIYQPTVRRLAKDYFIRRWGPPALTESGEPSPNETWRRRGLSKEAAEEMCQAIPHWQKHLREGKFDDLDVSKGNWRVNRD